MAKPLTINNTYFEEIEFRLRSVKHFNLTVFESITEQPVEDSLDAMEADGFINTEQKRIYEYFFKVGAATEYLQRMSIKGFNQEIKVLHGTNFSLIRKKNRINELIPFFHKVIMKLMAFFEEYTLEELDAFIEMPHAKRTKDVGSKILMLTAEYQKKISDEIGKGNIFSRDDHAKHWAKFIKKSGYFDFLSDHTFLKVVMSETDIRTYHLYVFYLFWTHQIEGFSEGFDSQMKFSLENILKNKPVQIILPKPIINEKIKPLIHQILKDYVTPDSHASLNDFFDGKDVKNKIVFLGGKQELMSVFLLLYKNNLITRKPTLIGELISQSFIAPYSTASGEISSERVREFISRTKDSDNFTVLPEIRKLAKTVKLHW